MAGTQPCGLPVEICYRTTPYKGSSNTTAIATQGCLENKIFKSGILGHHLSTLLPLKMSSITLATINKIENGYKQM